MKHVELHHVERPGRKQLSPVQRGCLFVVAAVIFVLSFSGLLGTLFLMGYL